MPDPLPRHIRFGPYRLDRAAREVRVADGALLTLTGKAFDTLCCLIDRRDRVVGKDELLATVWPGRVVEENNLTQAVSALRRAFGSDGRYIVTVPGHGYRFIADIDAGEAPPCSPESAAVVALAPVTDRRRPVSRVWGALADRRRPALRLWAALAGVLALAAALSWRPAAAPAQAPATRRPPVAGVAVGAQPTLAVLPFRSLSPGPRDELLELGLAETLIARISGASSLRVRSLASSQRFGNAGQDPLQAGRLLGAAYVVEGNTQRRGDRVRVNARLLAVRDGRALWSGTFDERIDRAFTLQDGIAAAVSSALALKVARPPLLGRSPCDGADAEAYRAYLAGQYQLDRPSAMRMRQALGQFRRAIDLDPTCARAYAGMAFAWRALVMTGDQDPRQMFPLAKAAVQKALVIDPKSAEAYASDGFIRFWYDWDWAGAEASFRRAIALNPSSAEARVAYAHLLSNLGRKEEAARQAREAIALDPLSPLVNTLGSSFLAATGRREEAAQALQKALEVQPDFWIALMVRAGRALQRRDYAAAIADLQLARQRCGDCSQALAQLGQAYARAGDRARAEQVLADMERRDAGGYMPATSMASLRMVLGDGEGALALLERGFQERDVRLTFLRTDRAWDPLRTQPRFQNLARRMGLPDKGPPATSAQGRSGG